MTESATGFEAFVISILLSALMSLTGDTCFALSFGIDFTSASDLIGVEGEGSCRTAIVDCDNGDAFAWLALRIVFPCGQRARSFVERGSRTILLGFGDLPGRVSGGDEVAAVADGVETFDKELARRSVVATFGGGAMA